MVNPNNVPTPSESSLPVVSPEICEAVATEIATDESYIRDSLEIMHTENPHMTDALSNLVV